MKLHAPWAHTPDDLASTLLFHGSGETWLDSQPRASRFDSCFWAVEGNPLIAQTYISRASQTMMRIDPYRLSEDIRPSQNHDLEWTIAKQLGASAADVTFDRLGHAQSWRRTGKRITHGDIRDYLERLGYDVQTRDSFWVNTVLDPVSKEPIALAKQARTPGRLILIEPGNALNVYDHAGGGEGDLQDPQHQHYSTFQQAFDHGYEAVRINDFCQSPAWGNVGHHALGLSQRAISYLHSIDRTLAIPAGHDDFSPEPGGLARTMTEDFMDWHFGQVVHALAQGMPVPVAVIDAHRERLDALTDSDKPIQVKAALDGTKIIDAPSLSAETMALVEQFERDLRRGEIPNGIPFQLNPEGHVTHAASNPDELAQCHAFEEAVKRQGLLVAVPAVVLNPLGRPLQAPDLRYAIDYWSAPPACRAYPSHA